MTSTARATLVILGLLIMVTGPSTGEDPAAPIEGFFTANDESVELPYAYAYREEGGFYDEEDPTWTLLFVDQPVKKADLDDMIWDAAYLRLGITETAEFDDEPSIQVYSQSIRFSAEQSGNISGGTYPELVMNSTGPDRFSGRVHHPEVQEFFDDTFQYDFTFDVPLSNPFPPVDEAPSAGGSLPADETLPVGDPLPAGGGEPGTAFVAWCDAIHAGDFDQIKALMPAEQAAMLESAEERELFEEDLEFIQMMTPNDVEVLSGSSDGETALLQVTGTFDGETAHGEITMNFIDGRWINTESAWK